MTTKRLRRGLIPAALMVLAACSAPTSDELLAAARQAISAGETRTAEIHLKNLLQRQPDNASARALLGEVLLAEGDAATAEQSLRKAAELGSAAAAIQLPLLRALLVQRKFDDVLEQIAAGPAATGDNRVAVLGISAAAHRGLGSFEAAEAAYRAALEIEPDSPGLRNELAAMFVQTGRMDAANELITAVLANQSDFVPALLLRGTVEFAAQRYAAAEAAFADVVSRLKDTPRAPEYFSALGQLVESELAQDEVEQAATNVDELLALRPENAVARYLKARVEVAQGDSDGAERRLESVIADFPEYWPAYTLLGSINSKQNQLGQAQMYLRAAVNSSPGDRAARLLLAELYIRQGDVADAKELFTRAGETPPSDGLFFALAGSASLQAGEAELASQYFERSEQSPRQTLEELVGVSTIYLATGEFERAIRVLSASSFDEPQSRGVADYLLLLAQLNEDDLSGARATAQRLADEVPEAPWLLNLRGTVALRSRDFSTARELFAGALKLDPSYFPALLNAARTALTLDNKDEAAAYLQRVIEIDPQQTAAMFGLALVAAQRGDFATAREWLGRMPESAARLRLEGEVAAAESRFDDAAAALSRLFALQPEADLALRIYTVAKQAGRPNPEAELLGWSAEHPRDALVNFALASIALQKRDDDVAIERYTAVLDAEPNHIPTLNNLAWLYSERGDARGFDLATRAHRAQPDNPSVADTLGWIHVRRGEAAQGLPLLEQAAAKAPNPEIRYHWAVALAETGDEERARGVLQVLLASGADFPSRRDAEDRVARRRE